MPSSYADNGPNRRILPILTRFRGNRSEEPLKIMAQLMGLNVNE